MIYEEIHYKCPKCGGSEVRVLNICTYPPTTCYRCTKCDYHHDEWPELKIKDVVAPTKK